MKSLTSGSAKISSMTSKPTDKLIKDYVRGKSALKDLRVELRPATRAPRPARAPPCTRASSRRRTPRRYRYS